MRTKLLSVLVALLVTGGLAACGDSSDTEEAAGGEKIVIGSFEPSEGQALASESEVLARIYGAALETAGATVAYQLKLGNREVVGSALESGKIDMVPEHLGSYLSFLDRSETKGQSTEKALRALQTLAARKGITVGEASSAENSDVIAVTKDLAAQHGLKTISDLKRLPAPITLAGPSDCATQETCLLGLRSAYGLDVAFTTTGTDAGGSMTKAALREGTAQIGRLFSSDPDTAKGGKFVILEDDRSFQQPGNIVPAIRTAKVTPAVLEILNKVSKALTTEKLVELNEKTDVDKEDPAAVAASFVSTEKL